MDATDPITFSSNRIDKAVSLLAAPVETGRPFFETAARALSMGLDYKWAAIGELADDGTSVNVLAFWSDDALAQPFSYSLADGPCEIVYEKHRYDIHHFYPHSVTTLFPKFELLKTLGAEAYRGELFLDADGNPAGHVVALMDSPDTDASAARALFRLIAQRTGAEYRKWKLEAALEQSESRYRSVIAMLPDGVVIHRDGKVVYANISAAHLLGASNPSVLIGKDICEIVHSEDYPRAAKRIWRVLKGGEIFRHVAQRFRRVDGTHFPGECSGIRVYLEDGPALVEVFRNVTRREDLEARQLQSQKLEAIGQLTGGIAHDFNNLLAVI